MASKDHGENGEDFSSTLAVFLAELAYLVLMVIITFFEITVLGGLKVFGAFMLVGFFVQTTILVLFQRERFAESTPEYLS